MSVRLPIWRPTPQSRWQRFRREPAGFIARWLHQRRPPLCRNLSAGQSHAITIVCISDTHQMEIVVPDGDLLLHAGDLTNHGSFEELQAQLDWLTSLPHSHKVVIAGNHDRLLDPEFVARFPDRICEREGASRADLEWYDLVYLKDSSVTLKFANGRLLNIFGSPSTPDCGTFAFQYPSIRDVWTGVVPQGTDILLTHGPPRGYLDLEGKGCPNLTREIARLQPRVVVFGHIHAGHGQEEVGYSGVERGYQKVMAGDDGWAIAIGMVLWLSAAWVETMVALVLGHAWPRRRVHTTMVNAAISGRSPEESRPAVVLEI